MALRRRRGKRCRGARAMGRCAQPRGQARCLWRISAVAGTISPQIETRGRLRMIDNLFLLAVAALGWGLSLATYRFFAARHAWPTGALHIDFPAIPVLLGLIAIVTAFVFASMRGADAGGW